MTPAQWKIVVRFMFEVMYMLNRKSGTPDTESNWSFEYELELELRKLDAEAPK